MKKFQLIQEDTVQVELDYRYETLYRIQSLRDFGDVKKGDLGGYVHCEANLSHDGNCWVYDNAYVYEHAVVYGNARIYHDARIHENAKVYGDARVYHEARVYRKAEVFENAAIFHEARVCGRTKVYGHAKLYDKSEATFLGKIYDYAEVYENAHILDGEVCGEEHVFGETRIDKGIRVGIPLKNGLKQEKGEKEQALLILSLLQEGKVDTVKEMFQRINDNCNRNSDAVILKKTC